MMKVSGQNLDCEGRKPSLRLGVNKNPNQTYADEANCSRYSSCPVVTTDTGSCDFECACDAEGETCDIHVLTFNAAVTLCEVAVVSPYS